MNIITDFKREEAIGKLLQTWESSVRATHLFLSEEDIDRIRPEVGSYVRDIPILACLRDEDGSLPGFIGLDGSKIEMLFIDANRRGQGLGRCLLAWAIDQHDARSLDVNEQNPQAVGFYQHCGFRITGRSATDGQGNPFPLLHMSR